MPYILTFCSFHSRAHLPAFLLFPDVPTNVHLPPSRGGWGYLAPSSPSSLFCSCSSGEILAHTLKAFMELMEHDFVSWETLSAAFIKKVSSSFCRLRNCAFGCLIALVT